jgi:hypothetical protein
MKNKTERPLKRSELPIYSKFQFKGKAGGKHITRVFLLNGNIEDAYNYCIRTWGVNTFREVKPLGI